MADKMYNLDADMFKKFSEDEAKNPSKKELTPKESPDTLREYSVKAAREDRARKISEGVKNPDAVKRYSPPTGYKSGGKVRGVGVAKRGYGKGKIT